MLHISSNPDRRFVRNLITLVARFNFRQFPATRFTRRLEGVGGGTYLVSKRQLVFNATAESRNIRSICQPDDTKIPGRPNFPNLLRARESGNIFVSSSTKSILRTKLAAARCNLSVGEKID